MASLDVPRATGPSPALSGLHFALARVSSRVRGCSIYLFFRGECQTASTITDDKKSSGSLCCVRLLLAQCYKHSGVNEIADDLKEYVMCCSENETFSKIQFVLICFDIREIRFPQSITSSSLWRRRRRRRIKTRHTGDSISSVYYIFEPLEEEEEEDQN